MKVPLTSDSAHAERLGEVGAHALAVGVGEPLGLHADGVVADEGDVDAALVLAGADGVAGDLLVVTRRRGRRDAELGAAAELQARG